MRAVVCAGDRDHKFSGVGQLSFFENRKNLKLSGIERRLRSLGPGNLVEITAASFAHDSFDVHDRVLSEREGAKELAKGAASAIPVTTDFGK